MTDWLTSTDIVSMSKAVLPTSDRKMLCTLHAIESVWFSIGYADTTIGLMFDVSDLDILEKMCNQPKSLLTNAFNLRLSFHFEISLVNTFLKCFRIHNLHTDALLWADILRDMFNPLYKNSFKPEPSSLFKEATDLANHIYNTPVTKGNTKPLDSESLLILSDMLEECGWPIDDGLLNHLRRPVWNRNDCHYRGCWALDLILGKD